MGKNSVQHPRQTSNQEKKEMSNLSQRVRTLRWTAHPEVGEGEHRNGEHDSEHGGEHDKESQGEQD